MIRHSKKLTAVQMSEMMAVDLSEYLKIESGELRPTEEQISKVKQFINQDDVSWFTKSLLIIELEEQAFRTMGKKEDTFESNT